MQILVVDDSELLRETFSVYLSVAGFTVQEAANGEDALRCCEENPSIEAIVTDLEMDRGDGLWLARELRGRGMTQRIVLASGAMTGREVFRTHPGLFDAFLEKPFNGAQLLHALGV